MDGTSSVDANVEDAPPGVSVWRRLLHLLKRALQLGLAFVLVYLVIALVGLIPVNNDFEETADGIEVLLSSNAVHSDIVLPLTMSTCDWREKFPADCFDGDTSAATHVAIGWGDKGFFLETPTWADLRASVAVNALLLPSSSCLHVSMTRAEFYRTQGRSVRISTQQYQQLVDHIVASMDVSGNGSAKLIAGASYGKSDAFFEAHGNYHCFNTCNSWVGRGLKKSGIRTPWISPLPKTVYWYFPRE